MSEVAAVKKTAQQWLLKTCHLHTGHNLVCPQILAVFKERNKHQFSPSLRNAITCCLLQVELSHCDPHPGAADRSLPHLPFKPSGAPACRGVSSSTSCLCQGEAGITPDLCLSSCCSSSAASTQPGQQEKLEAAKVSNLYLKHCRPIQFLRLFKLLICQKTLCSIPVNTITVLGS